MQLQPVKANLIYPSKANKTLELSQQQVYLLSSSWHYPHAAITMKQKTALHQKSLTLWAKSKKVR